MLKGSCHCGKTGWTLEGDPGGITACNCTVCRRYAALWAYDFEGERVAVTGPTASYTRHGPEKSPLEFLFCPTCACILAWRGLRLDERGRRRMAVNVRLAPLEEVGGLAIDLFDGLDTFEDLPRDGRCVRDFVF
jgi:hypothetical protein